jgi:hypothetical protein
MPELADISLFSILLPSGMVLFRWPRLPLSLKFIGIFILIKLILEFTAEFYLRQDTNNMFILHIYTFVEHIFLILYFRSLYEQKIVKHVLTGLMVAFLSFSVINVLKWEPLDTLPSTQRSIECIIGMLLGLYFFIDLFQKSNVTNLARYPHYWLVSGFLLYFAGTFFLNIVGDVAITTNQLSYDAYDIHAVVNTILNIIFTIVLWMGNKALTSEQ